MAPRSCASIRRLVIFACERAFGCTLGFVDGRVIQAVGKSAPNLRRFGNSTLPNAAHPMRRLWIDSLSRWDTAEEAFLDAVLAIDDRIKGS